MKEINFNGEFASQELTVLLDQVNFLLNIYYNFRIGTWYFDISFPDKTPILLGIKCVSNYKLLDELNVENLPLGDFVVFDSFDTTLGGLPARTEFGTGKRYKLIYIPEAEL